MQRAVERDEQSRSNYAMWVVSPSRVGKMFDAAALREIVDTIQNVRNCLLGIVSFNIEVRR
jgi:fatty acid synthase subunit alpha, fungi type